MGEERLRGQAANPASAAPVCPKLARSLGSAKAEFEKGITEGVSGAAKPKEQTVTMTRVELDALIVEREAKGWTAASIAPPPPPVD